MLSYILFPMVSELSRLSVQINPFISTRLHCLVNETREQTNCLELIHESRTND